MTKIDSKTKKVFTTAIRIVMLAFAVILAALYCPPLLAGILNVGNGFGFGVAALLVIGAVFFNKIRALAKKMFSHKRTKALLIVVVGAAIVFCIAFCSTLASVIGSAEYSASDQNTVLVLGCRIWGSTPSKALKARTAAAVEYMNKNENAVAILSGGQGSDENLSEAQCMFNLMTEQGINPSRLYIEDKSTNTDENVANSKQIIEKNNLDTNVAVATSDYHQKRAAMICKKNGLTSASLPAKSGAPSRATFYTREIFGVWVQYLKMIAGK